MRKWTRPCLAVALLISTPALAESKLLLFGLADSGNYVAVPETVEYLPNMALGGGISYEFALGPKAGLEIGAAYQKRSQGASVGTNTVTQTYLHAPVILRYWFGRGFGLGVGGYYGMGLGDISNSETASLTYEAA